MKQLFKLWILTFVSFQLNAGEHKDFKVNRKTTEPGIKVSLTSKLRHRSNIRKNNNFNISQNEASVEVQNSNISANETICENSTTTFTGTGFPIGSGTFPAGRYQLVLVDNATNLIVGNAISNQVILDNRGPLLIQSYPINANLFPSNILPTNFVYRLTRFGALFNEIAPVTVDIILNSDNITSIVAFQNYTWANSGQTYTQSGVYTGTTTNCVTEKLNLTITNQPPIKVLDFDGVNDYASIPNNATLNPIKFTIDTWIKWGRSGTVIDFICSKAGEVMELQTGGVVGNNIRFIPVPGVFLDGGLNTITPGT